MVGTLWRPGGLIISVPALSYCDKGSTHLKARSFRCFLIWLTLEITYFLFGRLGGLMLVSSPPERAAEDTMLCSWERHFTLTVLLSTRAYK